jgi:hypothetical protein
MNFLEEIYFVIVLKFGHLDASTMDLRKSVRRLCFQIVSFDINHFLTKITLLHDSHVREFSAT